MPTIVVLLEGFAVGGVVSSDLVDQGAIKLLSDFHKVTKLRKSYREGLEYLVQTLPELQQWAASQPTHP